MKIQITIAVVFTRADMVVIMSFLFHIHMQTAVIPIQTRILTMDITVKNVPAKLVRTDIPKQPRRIVFQICSGLPKAELTAIT